VAADLTEPSGTTLYTEVAVGGGSGGADGAGGGGESDLRSCSITDPSCPPLGAPNDPRLVVAGGGGGSSFGPAGSTFGTTAAGTLPPNVSFTVNGNGTATLSGVPTGNAKAYAITFKATLGTAATTQKFMLTTTS
jgi:hypothetical protein